MNKLLLAIFLIGAVANVASADGAADKADAHKVALEFLAAVDRGDKAAALKMFTPSVTVLDSSIDSLRAAKIPVPAEIEKQREDEVRRVNALRESEFERETEKRQARGRLQNTREQWFERFAHTSNFGFEFVSEAEKPAMAPGGETRQTVAAVRVAKDLGSGGYKIVRFTTEY